VVDTKHALATYLRVMGATVRDSGKNVRAIDTWLAADVFQACAGRELLAAMSPQSRRRAKPMPEDYLRARFAVRFREYCEVGAEEYGEHVRDWAEKHGNDVLRKLEDFAEARRIWQEVVDQGLSKLTSESNQFQS
jgi:hypothetical protein